MRNLFILIACISFCFSLHNYSHAQKQETIAQDTIARDTIPNTVFPRWWTVFEVGIQSGLGDVEKNGYIYPNSSTLPGFQIINSFLVHPHIIAGLGIGVQPYNEGTMMPLFLNLRAFLGEKIFLPMITFDGGFSFGWPREPGEMEWVGLMINPAIGFIIKHSEKGALFLRAGYRLQKTGYTSGYDHVMVFTDHLSVRIGFKF